MSKARRKLPRAIAKRIDQAANAARMSREILPGPQPLVDELAAATEDLKAKQAAALEIRQLTLQATSELRQSAKQLNYAYGNLAAHVETSAVGRSTMILGAGFDLWSVRTPLAPLAAPTNLRARVPTMPGMVLLSWTPEYGARLYQVQYTMDLSGSSGWTDVPENATTARLSVEGLASGTRYAFRVRACARGIPGPWSPAVQQMAP